MARFIKCKQYKHYTYNNKSNWNFDIAIQKIQNFSTQTLHIIVKLLSILSIHNTDHVCFTHIVHGNLAFIIQSEQRYFAAVPLFYI